jgi:phospholipase C
MRVSMIVSLLLPALLPAVALAQPPTPLTPVEHVVIIFQENQSFDHYFGTYPIAANPPGRTAISSRTRNSIRQWPGRRAPSKEPEPERAFPDRSF